MASIHQSESSSSLSSIEFPRESCGVFAIATDEADAARLTYFGIYALQHRGQESAGIAVSNGVAIWMHKAMGLVAQVFNNEIIDDLQGMYAIGHTRYSTTGSSNLGNAQPFKIETRHGPIALAHNGNLVNAAELRQELLQHGVGLTSTSDTELMALMVAAAEGDDWMERISASMVRWIGAFSVVILTNEGVFAARDPWGLRPLSIGQLPGGNHAVASETGALETIGCGAVRETKPGEVVALHKSALIVRQALPPNQPLSLCTFEHIYFSRPDSIWDGLVVNEVRYRLGEQLAREAPVEADIVIPVPDSSIPAALGYSNANDIPFRTGLIKNRYIGRTFIQPSQEMRKSGVHLKFNPLPSALKDMRVVVIDDSIVRGTTAGYLVDIIRRAGAKEIHMRITCPPIQYPCFMGVDMPTREELIGNQHSVPEICRLIGADSLHYLSLSAMIEAIDSQSGYCNACFTGEYPIEITSGISKELFEAQQAMD